MFSKVLTGRIALNSLLTLIPLVLCASAFAAGTLEAQTSYLWTRSGPVVGTVNALAIAPGNSAIRYAGILTNTGGFGATSNSGVYRSSDSGATWSRTALLPSRIVYSLAVDPGNPNIVYSGTFRGLSKSTDGGASWTNTYPDTNATIAALLIQPNDASVIYASVFGNGMYKSTNAGSTWSSISSGIQFYGIHGLAMDPVNTNILYAAAGYGSGFAIYKSTDAGAHWTSIGTGIPDSTNDVLAIALSPSNNSILYAGKGNSVFKSTDAGDHWNAAATGLPNSPVTSLAIDPVNAANVLAGTATQGVFKSTNGGGTWNPTSLAAPGVDALIFESGQSNNVYAGSRGMGIRKSTDAGETWTAGSDKPLADVRELTPNPQNSQVLYANTVDGIFKTGDGGANWSYSVNVNINVIAGLPTHKVVIDPANPAMLYAGSDNGGILRTVNGGANWNLIYQTTNVNIDALTIDPVLPQNIYLATTFGLFKSPNGGTSWNPINGPFNVLVMAVDPINSDTVYAGTSFGVWKSTNGGTSWVITSLHTGGILSLALDPANSSTIYAASYNGGAYKSSNGGASWDPAFTDVAGHVLAFAFDPTSPGTVFTGTEQGVYLSTNGGQSSGNFSNGLPAGAKPVVSLSYDSMGRNLYAGTPDSVYTLSLGPVVDNPVSGRVADTSGAGIAGVTMTISGASNGQTLTTLTDGSGNYSFNNSIGGDTLTPSKAGYIFDPSFVKSVSSGGPIPITGVFNFLGGTATYTLSGRVIDGTGAGLSNVLVTVTGSQQRGQVTDGNGNYAIQGLFAGGHFTITPSQSGFVFNPPQVGFTNLPAGDRTLPTFVGTMHPINISGQIKDSQNNPLSGVLLSLQRVGGTDGVAASTNSSGNYSFTNVASEASYVLTPSKTGFSFNPASVTFTTPSTNQTADFAAAPPPALQFSATNYDVGEGDVSVVLTVNRTGDTSVVSSVDFASSNGTASQLRDYQVANGTLTFAAGQTTRTLRLLIVDDVFAEPNETINLTLSNATGGVLIAPTTATVTIIDNDSAGATSPVARQFVSNLVGADEVPATTNTIKGNGGIFQLTPDETSAKVSLVFSGLTGTQTGAHIHAGSFGVNGPILFPLPLGNPVNNFVVNPTAQQVTELRAGGHYMNVHSSNFPDGEIRGQLQWNPAEEAEFFVRQAYFDFLSRVPDAGGFAFWTNEITQCQSDVECLRRKRVDVSNAFFYEQEFQQTAAYVLRLYRAAYGNNQPFPNPNPNAAFPNEEKKLPSYAVFVADRSRVVGGTNLAQRQLDLANLFVTRAEFLTKYPANLGTAEQFVDSLLLTMQTDLGVNLTGQRAALIDVYNTQGGRGAVLYRLADDNAAGPIGNQLFIDEEYNRSFVLGQYFGYLRRNPDIPGFMFWLGQVNGAPLRNVPKQHSMVCSFITSGEFQFRFGPVASRNNNECSQ